MIDLHPRTILESKDNEESIETLPKGSTDHSPDLRVLLSSNAIEIHSAVVIGSDGALDHVPQSFSSITLSLARQMLNALSVWGRPLLNRG